MHFLNEKISSILAESILSHSFKNLELEKGNNIQMLSFLHYVRS